MQYGLNQAKGFAGLAAWIVVTVCLVFTTSQAAWAAQNGPLVVRVGGYEFPPYVSFAPGSGTATGLTPDLIELLNASQDTVRFEFEAITPADRFSALSSGRIDAIFFEDNSWGWAGQAYAATPVLLEDSEIYLALRRPGRNDSFFNYLSVLRVLGYAGYHYPSYNGETNPELLAARGLTVTQSHAANIESILEGKADVAIVTKSFARIYLRDRPRLMRRTLLSTSVEQRYLLRILVKPNKGTLLRLLETCLTDLRRDGSLELLYGKYALDPAKTTAREE